MRKGTVIRDYVRAYPNPITLKTGEKVAISHCDIEYPGWIWTTNQLNISGWVPQQILHITQPNQAICNENYTAHELTVKTGEHLYLERVLNGWYWAHKISGETGWIPQEYIKF
ncbi:variant SH3 domain protein [Xenorhabdus mauleonii]|uniref:Variant SH3 domain protein n=1 Tax=Xenorhabdus mauleonii TaxID=351675 RepID=A0A1I3X5H8_9GAMM|nr:SH3 domain-containing protein [Xenorhabdus mauleonii]PHM46308.1 variant SH3 domain protein [Xenorhabdus mauleonii]SFK14895.1 Variant SH3 domain-containing protein [Xenorhabdus mauleonii]